ncbi:hypothetical protein OAP17_02225 [Porticoccaceae bacterium]|nr:hypothetical protein [Porticoccaceae bacterium]
MKLNELPHHFWLDTRTDAIERQKIEYITRDFRKTLRDTGVSYCLYGLTITANEKFVRGAGIWLDDDARNELLGNIYNSFIHRISSAIEPNYKRNTHAHKRFISWGAIEHLSRNKTASDKDGVSVAERVAPHIHATVAVHPAWEDEFLSCFQRNFSRDHFSLSPDFINRGMTNWVKQVASVRLEVVWDEYEWSGYCLKQVPHHSQIDEYEKSNTGLFNHNGLTKKPITDNEEDLPMRLTKNAVITDINQSHSVDAVRLSKDELPADKNKRLNDLKREIDRRVRQNKDLTIVIVE